MGQLPITKLHTVAQLSLIKMSVKQLPFHHLYLMMIIIVIYLKFFLPIAILVITLL